MVKDIISVAAIS